MDNEAVSIDTLLNEHFQGKVVRKDLTKFLKEGANVPVYVLEYLLGMYCASDDEEVIQEGITSVKDILSKNYVRPRTRLRRSNPPSGSGAASRSSTRSRSNSMKSGTATRPFSPTWAPRVWRSPATRSRNSRSS